MRPCLLREASPGAGYLFGTFAASGLRCWLSASDGRDGIPTFVLRLNTMKDSQ